MADKNDVSKYSAGLCARSIKYRFRRYIPKPCPVITGKKFFEHQLVTITMLLAYELLLSYRFFFYDELETIQFYLSYLSFVAVT